ncbi:MAG TPA: ABC transporter ATP-binding protein [Propionibacterium sp.]|nr:ABC transporter ATP-binding protein [Propionibacterium sp.]
MSATTLAPTTTPVPTPTPAVIRTDKLSKTFSNAGTQQHVLKNLDLEIEENSFTVIMGPSGSGKSTLLYALSGMDRPTLGTVTVAGTDISRFSENRLARFRRQHCGFVFQQIHLLDSMTVMDNVMAVGLLTNRDRGAVRRRAEELFELVGLKPADHRKFPAMLSGGEAQRVGIARGLINDPTVLFADEPTGQLNSETGRLVLDLLSQVNEAGQTVVMVTHDLRSAARGSRILYLRDGSITGEHRLAADADEAERTQQTATFLAEMGW